MLLLMAAQRSGRWGPFTAPEVLELEEDLNPGGYATHVEWAERTGRRPKPPLTVPRIQKALARLVSIGLAVEA